MRKGDKMNKFTSMLEKILLPLANKLSANRYLKAISNGFAVLLPITMIGAIFTLLANLQIDVYQQAIQAINLKQILAFAPTVTTDMLAVYAVFLIGKELSTLLGLDKESGIIGSISLFAFLILIPLGATGVAETSKEVVMVAGVLKTTYLGAAGLFSAMIIGLVVPTIYNLFIKHNIVLKMPPQVPPTISKSFSALIPAFAIAFIFCLVRFGFTFTEWGSANEFIYSMLRTPLASLGASPITFIIFIIMCSIMWFFGLHGGMIVMPFITMLYATPGLENIAAMGAGTALPNIITKSTWSLFASLGGAGGTLGLCVLLCFFAKSARYKTLGKIALPAGFCGINEPITFGLPMVLNTIMLIPLIITPIITFLISYTVMSLGFIPFPNGVEIPLGTPVIFSGLIGLGWQGALLQVGLILLQVGIYLPFVKILDRQACLEEQATSTN